MRKCANICQYQNQYVALIPRSYTGEVSAIISEIHENQGNLKVAINHERTVGTLEVCDEKNSRFLQCPLS